MILFCKNTSCPLNINKHCSREVPCINEAGACDMLYESNGMLKMNPRFDLENRYEEDIWIEGDFNEHIGADCKGGDIK